MEKHYLARKDGKIGNVVCSELNSVLQPCTLPLGWSKTQNELTEDFDQILNLLLRSSRNLTDERRNVSDLNGIYKIDIDSLLDNPSLPVSLVQVFRLEDS